MGEGLGCPAGLSSAAQWLRRVAVAVVRLFPHRRRIGIPARSRATYGGGSGRCGRDGWFAPMVVDSTVQQAAQKRTWRAGSGLAGLGVFHTGSYSAVTQEIRHSAPRLQMHSIGGVALSRDLLPDYKRYYGAEDDGLAASGSGFSS